MTRRERLDLRERVLLAWERGRIGLANAERCLALLDGASGLDPVLFTPELRRDMAVSFLEKAGA